MTNGTLQPVPDEMFLEIPGEKITIPIDLEAQDQRAIPLSEGYAHLVNALDIFETVLDLDRKGRLYPIPKNAPSDHIPTKQQVMSINSRESAQNRRDEAKHHFLRAYGLAAMLATDYGVPPEQIEKEAGRRYDRFTMDFAGRHRFRDRLKAREKWTGLLKKSLRIESEAAFPTELSDVTEERQQPGLSTREKLILMAEANDAGFLPTMQEEKNMAVTYLDYIISSKFVLGPQTQLLEVGGFHGKHQDFFTAREYAAKAGRSIAHEFADWFSQATEQLDDLRAVKQLLDEIYNPNLSLAVALNADMLKAVPLVRYLDLVEFRATGKVEHEIDGVSVTPNFDVLRTRRNEAPANLVPGKNKVLEDPYFTKDADGKRPERVKRWLKKRMEQIKVGDARKCIETAIIDQENRAEFHELVLEDLATEKTTDSEILQEASKVARRVLEKVN